MVDMRFMKNIVDNAMGTTNKVAKSAPVQKSKVRKYDNENEEFEFSDITFGESFSVDSDYGRLEFWTNGPQEGRTQSYFTGNIPHLDVGITIDITVEKIDGYTCECSYVENYYNYETGKEVEYDNGTCDGEINRDGKITSIYGIYVDFGIEEVTKSKKAVKSKAKKSAIKKFSVIDSWVEKVDTIKQLYKEFESMDTDAYDEREAKLFHTIDDSLDEYIEVLDRFIRNN